MSLPTSSILFPNSPGEESELLSGGPTWIERKDRVPIGSSVRTITKGRWVDLPFVYVPIGPPIATEDLPSKGYRPATPSELQPMQAARLGRHGWVVLPCGSMSPALRTTALSETSWRLQEPCPFCAVHHKHGAGEGHRKSHCGGTAHPWSRGGYYLHAPDNGPWQ